MSFDIEYVYSNSRKETMFTMDERKELLTYLTDSRETLEVLPNRKHVKDLQMKERIFLAGIIWSKFTEDSKGNAYILADEKLCDMEFGRNNDWRESPIRQFLNNEVYQKIIEELGVDALITIQTDLFSHDGLRDYGKCDDMVSLLTYDLYRNNRESIKDFREWYWTCTPDSTPSGCNSCNVQFVSYDGYANYYWCDSPGAVRPFCIIKSDILVSVNNRQNNTAQ